MANSLEDKVLSAADGMVKQLPTHGNIHSSMESAIAKLNRDCDSLNKNCSKNCWKKSVTGAGL